MMSNKDIDKVNKSLANTAKILDRIGRRMDKIQEAEEKKWAKWEQEQKAEREKQAEERKRQTEEQRAERKKQAEERKRQTEEQRAERKKQAEERKRQTEEQRAERKKQAEERKKWEEELKGYRKEFNQFMDRTGDLEENLAISGLINQFNKRGIKIDRVIQDHPASHIIEFDFIALNDTEAVVIEVKCNLKHSDVYKFLKRLKQVQKICLELKLKDKKVYGAVAFLTNSTKKSRDVAQKEGLFLISGTGDTIIESPKNFKPKLIELEAD